MSYALSKSSKLPTTTTLSINVATEELLNNKSKWMVASSKPKLLTTLEIFWKPSKSLLSPILCIEISNLVISFYTTVSSNWLTLDFVSLSKMQEISLKLCLDHPSTWHQKYLKDKFIQWSQIFGLLELSSIKCSMDSVPLKKKPSQDWSLLLTSLP